MRVALAAMKALPPAPKPPTPPEVLDLCNHLVGEFMGLKAFCAALIATHPDPAALRAEFERQAEALTAGFQANPHIPARTVAGMRAAVDELNGQLAGGE